MKTILKHIFLIALFFSFAALTKAQVDSTETETPVVEETKAPKEKRDRKISDFKVYGGLSTSQIILSDSEAESAYSAGYTVGVSYRRGKYFYWEIGANYNGVVVGFEDVLRTENTLEYRQMNFPVTAGLNILGETRRVLGLRTFVGLVPGVVTDVLNNPFEITKDDFNDFQMGGRLALGVDVLFLFVEID